MLEQIESFCINFYWPGELTVTDVPPQISLYMIYSTNIFRFIYIFIVTKILTKIVMLFIQNKIIRIDRIPIRRLYCYTYRLHKIGLAVPFQI